MDTNKQTNIKVWLWLPTIYFTRGLPYVIVFLVSLVFFNRMGQSNSTITLNTSWTFIPFILRPLLGRIVTGYATKRFWVLAMQLLMTVSMFGIALSINYFLIGEVNFYVVLIYNCMRCRCTRCGCSEILQTLYATQTTKSLVVYILYSC